MEQYQKNSRKKNEWIGCVLRHDRVAGIDYRRVRVEDKNYKGRPRVEYVRQITRDQGCNPYVESKRMASNREEWSKPISGLNTGKRRREEHACRSRTHSRTYTGRVNLLIKTDSVQSESFIFHNYIIIAIKLFVQKIYQLGPMKNHYS